MTLSAVRTGQAETNAVRVKQMVAQLSKARQSWAAANPTYDPSTNATAPDVEFASQLNFVASPSQIISAPVTGCFGNNLNACKTGQGPSGTSYQMADGGVLTPEGTRVSLPDSSGQKHYILMYSYDPDGTGTAGNVLIAMDYDSGRITPLDSSGFQGVTCYSYAPPSFMNNYFNDPTITYDGTMAVTPSNCNN